jgi:hypothetical protein
MPHLLSVEPPGLPAQEVTLDRAATAGGSNADVVHLPGAPPSALRLAPGPAGVVVTADTVGVRAVGRPLAPGGRRLVRGGETVELHGTVLSVLAASRTEDTRAAASGLVAEAAAGEVPLAGPHLVVLTGTAAGRRFPVGREETIGRGRGASIRLPDAEASRRHARVRIAGGAATIEDLGSSNGLRVNGVPVDRRAAPLRAGDEIVLGGTALAFEDPFARAESSGERAQDPPATRRRPGIPTPHAAAATLLAVAAALVLAGS